MSMELRHLRCFTAVAEELHFTRAAERLHIEQSPLSRTIKELEADLGIRLFDRNRQGTQLTRAGQAFWGDLHRVFSALDQACTNAAAAAHGYHGVLRIAVSDGIAASRLAALLTSCREQTPEVAIHLFEVSLAEQIKGLRQGLYDAGFAQSHVTDRDLVAQSAWTESVRVALPKRHPLLGYKCVPVDELSHYSVILFHPTTHAGYCEQIKQLLQATNAGNAPCALEHITSMELLMALVAAGYGVGLITPSQMSMLQHKDILARPLASETANLKTYLIRPDRELSKPLQQFIAALHAVNDEPVARSRNDDLT